MNCQFPNQHDLGYEYKESLAQKPFITGRPMILKFFEKLF